MHIYYTRVHNCEDFYGKTFWQSHLTILYCAAIIWINPFYFL
jgi:hypothetical protein